jgi:hypothetical protein
MPFKPKPPANPKYFDDDAEYNHLFEQQYGKEFKNQSVVRDVSVLNTISKCSEEIARLAERDDYASPENVELMRRLRERKDEIENQNLSKSKNSNGIDGGALAISITSSIMDALVVAKQITPDVAEIAKEAAKKEIQSQTQRSTSLPAEMVETTRSGRVLEKSELSQTIPGFDTKTAVRIKRGWWKVSNGTQDRTFAARDSWTPELQAEIEAEQAQIEQNRFGAVE